MKRFHQPNLNYYSSPSDKWNLNGKYFLLVEISLFFYLAKCAPCVTEVLYMIDEQSKIRKAWWKCKNCWQRKMENFWQILGLFVAQQNIFHSVLGFKVMSNSPLLTQCFVNCFLLFFMSRTSEYNFFIVTVLQACRLCNFRKSTWNMEIWWKRGSQNINPESGWVA